LQSASPLAQENVYSALATLRLLAARSSSKNPATAGNAKAAGCTTASSMASGKLPTVVETVEVESQCSTTDGSAELLTPLATPGPTPLGALAMVACKGQLLLRSGASVASTAAPPPAPPHPLALPRPRHPRQRSSTLLPPSRQRSACPRRLTPRRQRSPWRAQGRCCRPRQSRRRRGRSPRRCVLRRRRAFGRRRGRPRRGRRGPARGLPGRRRRSVGSRRFWRRCHRHE